MAFPQNQTQEEQALAYAISLSIKTAEEEERERVRRDIQLVERAYDLQIPARPPPIGRPVRGCRSLTPDASSLSSSNDINQSEPPPEKWQPLRPPPPSLGRRSRTPTHDAQSHHAPAISGKQTTTNQYSSLPRPRSVNRNAYLNRERAESPTPARASSPIYQNSSTFKQPPPALPAVGPNANTRSKSFNLPPPEPSSRPTKRTTTRYKVIETTDLLDKPAAESCDSSQNEQPLIQLSPPPKRNDRQDFDIRSLDPLNHDFLQPQSMQNTRKSLPIPTVSNPLSSLSLKNENQNMSPGFTIGSNKEPSLRDPFDFFDSMYQMKSSQSAGNLHNTRQISLSKQDSQNGMEWSAHNTTTDFTAPTFQNNGAAQNRLSSDAPEDLMAFSSSELDLRRMEEEFLSLESFDPFYSTQDDISESVFSGSETTEPKSTPDPFPNLLSSPLVCMSGQLPSSSKNSQKGVPPSPPGQASYKRYTMLKTGDLTDPDEGQVREETEDVPKYSIETKDQYLELLDPFSFNDLALLLEQKRKAKEESKQAEERASVVMRTKVGGNDRKQIAQRNRQVSVIDKPMDTGFELLRETREHEDEVTAFCHMVARLKLQHKHSNHVCNSGLISSPRILNIPVPKMEVKVIVNCIYAVEPIIFTCDLSTLVEHIIMHVLTTLTDDLGSTSTDDYVMKVHGLSEYLINNSKLYDYEYVQNCLKLDLDIHLTLQSISKVNRTLLRTAEDDRQPVFMPKRELDEKRTSKITKDTLNILMETYFKEAEKLSQQSFQVDVTQLKTKSLIQSVKAICATLSKIETIDIIKAVERLQAVTTEEGLVKAGNDDHDMFMYVTRDGDSVIPVRDSDKLMKKATRQDDLQGALELLTSAVKGLVDMYCRAFHADFRFNSKAVKSERREVTQVLDNLIVQVASMHRIPQKCKDSYEEYQITCGVYYAGKKLCTDIMSQKVPFRAVSFQDSVIWDEWMQFADLSLCMVPRETRLLFILTGYKTIAASNSTDTGTKISHILGWVAQPVFNFRHELVKGSHLLGLWPDNKPDPTGSSMSNTVLPQSILIQINLPEFECEVFFPAVIDNGPNFAQDFDCLHPKTQEELEAMLHKDSACRINQEDCEALWEKRYFLCGRAAALSRVLLAAHSWDWANLCDVYNLMRVWQDLSPIQALQLLLPRYADEHVRTKAVDWLRAMPSEELCDFLPQLVQILKFESFHNSALARFLLERAATNLRIAHSLYWLLKDAAEDIQFCKRYQLLYGALMSVVGQAMRDEFQAEEELVRKLAIVADKVKKAKDKDTMLVRELEKIYDLINNTPLRLPFNPGIEVAGIDIKSCSYFTSFTFPLKLVLRNIDEKAVSVYTMFKDGDDLRQDMLTMQIVRLMDRLWRRDGLDLKIITFKCLPTGAKKGLVELITESETLRKIQMKYGHGVAGSFKDKSIEKWLTGQNPSELEYKKAVENFTSSCAGYCVATYVLGICDRHNDNIMIKHSGHLFHIDFGKFLGDTQMFGSIKRDRVPFVLTSDMVYVINGGDRPSMQFQEFVDLCCQAFNIIRKHGNLLLTLFMSMTRSGIPGVTDSAVKYIQRALMPDLSDAEATAAFTRMIEGSMSSMSTQINFFFHNLAQLKFTGHSEGALLSFIPKTYSIHTDGKIRNVAIFGYQKRYNPEKYYIYIIKVEREHQTVPTFIFRRYSEFYEFHHKLIVMFPLAKLPNLPGKIYFGRTHIKTVAEARKIELEKFLLQLLNLAPEISEHDIVYTYFHTMLRDEQDAGKTNLQKLREPKSPRQPFNMVIKGQVKLSLVYRNSALEILVMHVKELSGGQGVITPDPYVKTYLLPDPSKFTKRKTKICRGSFHPTFNEVLMYRMKLEEVRRRILQVSVWNYDRLKENESMGAVHLDLSELDLSKSTTKWYPLGPLHKMRL